MSSPHKYHKNARHCPENIREDWQAYWSPQALVERKKAAHEDYMKRLETRRSNKTIVRGIA